MIPALLIGREGSQGFPNKNIYPVLGRALMEYPLLAAQRASQVDDVYVSTDSARIKDVASRNSTQVIDRPDYLCTKDALGEDAFKHGYHHIQEVSGREVELIVLLFCNAPCVLPSQIDEGIRVLRENPEYDSAVTVSRYNMYSPIRARKIGQGGLLQPFVPFENYPREMDVNCDRDSQGDVYFADVSLSIVRPRCLENLEYGILPQKWMGQKIYPITQEGGLDVDYEWQLPLAIHWLQEHGFADESAMVVPEEQFIEHV